MSGKKAKTTDPVVENETQGDVSPVDQEQVSDTSEMESTSDGSDASDTGDLESGVAEQGGEVPTINEAPVVIPRNKSRP